MRNVPIHWLLLVCFLATPLAHGQATTAAPMSPHEFATALLNLATQPQETPRVRTAVAAKPAQPCQVRVRDPHAAVFSTVGVAPIQPSAELSPAQPAGP
jgi:hypothetical protein